MEVVRWAEALGYDAIEYHLVTETGADAIFQNYVGDKMILEVVTGGNFKKLFRKPRIKEALTKDMEYYVVHEYVGLVVVGDRIDNVRKHGIEVGLQEEFFLQPHQKSSLC